MTICKVVKSSCAIFLGRTWLIYNTDPCYDLNLLYLKIIKDRLRNVGSSVLTSSFKCTNIANIFEVQLGHVPGSDMARFQYRSLLGPILAISKIFKRFAERCWLQSVNKQGSIANICEVQLGHFPWSDLAHFQYRSLLGPILAISKIFKSDLLRGVDSSLLTNKEVLRIFVKSNWAIFLGWPGFFSIPILVRTHTAIYKISKRHVERLTLLFLNKMPAISFY